MAVEDQVDRLRSGRPLRSIPGAIPIRLPNRPDVLAKTLQLLGGEVDDRIRGRCRLAPLGRVTPAPSPPLPQLRVVALYVHRFEGIASRGLLGIPGAGRKIECLRHAPPRAAPAPTAPASSTNPYLARVWRCHDMLPGLSSSSSAARVAVRGPSRRRASSRAMRMGWATARIRRASTTLSSERDGALAGSGSAHRTELSGEWGAARRMPRSTRNQPVDSRTERWPLGRRLGRSVAAPLGVGRAPSRPDGLARARRPAVTATDAREPPFLRPSPITEVLSQDYSSQVPLSMTGSRRGRRRWGHPAGWLGHSPGGCPTNWPRRAKASKCLRTPPMVRSDSFFTDPGGAGRVQGSRRRSAQRGISGPMADRRAGAVATAAPAFLAHRHARSSACQTVGGARRPVLTDRRHADGRFRAVCPHRERPRPAGGTHPPGRHGSRRDRYGDGVRPPPGRHPGTRRSGRGPSPGRSTPLASAPRRRTSTRYAGSQRSTISLPARPIPAGAASSCPAAWPT